MTTTSIIIERETSNLRNRVLELENENLKKKISELEEQLEGIQIISTERFQYFSIVEEKKKKERYSKCRFNFARSMAKIFKK